MIDTKYKSADRNQRVSEYIINTIWDIWVQQLFKNGTKKSLKKKTLRFVIQKNLYRRIV